MADRYDVVVIGGGPGGFRAARVAARRGASVALIEKQYLGGTCLNWGCIPSKALLAAAHALLAARHAAEMGLDIPSATPNWPVIQQRKDAIITGFRKGMAGSAKAHGFNVIPGRAVITAPGRIEVQGESGNTSLEAGKIVIATGSETTLLPTIPVDGRTVITSKEALSLPNIPASMAIIGGGVIGCEMACVYAAMGTQVTIIEALDQLCPMTDQWVGRLLEREFKKLGINSLVSRKVASVDTSVAPARVALEDGTTLNAEKVLVSVGRRAVVDETVAALNLRMNGRVIAVNDKLETSVPGVYAIGDVVGTTYLAHGATAEGDVAAANATGADERMEDYDMVPRVIFTFPEVASVGKSERQCEQLGLDITVGKAFFKANGRAVAHNALSGQARVIRDNATNNVVGITLVGEGATEYAPLASTLIGKSDKVTKIIFPHPTVSEVLEDAVLDAVGPVLYGPPGL